MGRHPFLLRRQAELLLAELNAAPSAGNAYADLEFRDKLVRDVGKDAFSGRKAAVAAEAAVNIPVAAKRSRTQHRFRGIRFPSRAAQSKC